MAALAQLCMHQAFLQGWKYKPVNASAAGGQIFLQEQAPCHGFIND